MDLYTSTTFKCSRIITQDYSTSFTLGIRTLSKKFHFPIYAVYGFVRYADEIVDTFHRHDKKELLHRFKEETFRAIDEEISLNPVLHAFQVVVHKYHIENQLIEAFLQSMEMDLRKKAHDQTSYEQYIYGSAEVVGLMCLKIFCEGDKSLYDFLKTPAKKLGAAFQKVNFLRDIKSDFNDRGRIYFPGINFEVFEARAKRKIEQDIEADFREALEGIKRLPKGAKMGVYLAYIYYVTLFKKIKNLSANRIMSERVRIPNLKKFLLLINTYFRTQLGVI